MYVLRQIDSLKYRTYICICNINLTIIAFIKKFKVVRQIDCDRLHLLPATLPHVYCTCTVHVYCTCTVHVYCTCTVHVYCTCTVHVYCTCILYMCTVHVYCTCILYMYTVHVCCTCILYMYTVHVYCTCMLCKSSCHPAIPNLHRLGHQRITCGPLLNSSKSIH